MPKARRLRSSERVGHVVEGRRYARSPGSPNAA